MSTGIASSWARIEAWLKEHAPEAAKSIGPPAPEAEIAGAEEKLGFALPDELKALYGVVGLAEGAFELPSICLGPEDEHIDCSFYILSVAEMLEEWGTWRDLTEIGEFNDCTPEHTDPGVVETWWSTKWVPFAANGGGDCFAIDLGPAEGGKAGQIVGHSHETGEHRVLAPSLNAYLADIADGIESGRYIYDEDEQMLVRAGG